MADRARRVRTADGTEHVLVSLAEYEALLEAATAAPLTPELTRQVVARLRENFEADRPGIDLDDFIAGYDAAHPAD
jgi:hypothetical protein